MALSRSLACNGCRQYLLKSFISTFAIPSNTTTQRRNFSAPARRRNEARERIQLGEKEEIVVEDIKTTGNPFKAEENAAEAEQNHPEIPESPPESAEEHIPWYLRSTSPTLPPTPPSAFSARQTIPSLPPSPPPLLAPLLPQISISLGIDDLTLLDLRSLDPPPALGANLLMLIGTARSEKHLHVSADKLCRWLRSEWDLAPFADGLLGRQELKLKLRRKAKRNRLMSAVGGKVGEGEDLAEGIRTGWVCVNVGEVEGCGGEGVEGEGERVLEGETGEFVGFGPGRREGVRIVVQMLTEEKRGEVDLERLWSAVLRKSEREKEAIAAQEAVQEEEEILEVEDVVEPAKMEAEEILPKVEEPVAEEAGEQHPPARIRGLRGRQHIRAFHTSTRRLQAPTTESKDKASWDAIAQSASPPKSTADPTQQPADLQTFYKTWSTFPALRVPRSAALYTTFLTRLAAGILPPSEDDDGHILGHQVENLTGIPNHESPECRTLRAVRTAAEARALLANTLCEMEAEVPRIDLEGEGGGELAMAVLKAVRAVDPEGLERGSKVWGERCERILRRDGAVGGGR